MPTPRQLFFEERNAKWRKEYEAGATLRDIAARYDFVSLTAIRNGIVKAGGTIHPTGYPKGQKDKNKPKRGLLGWLEQAQS